jgi:hypothetical protein
MRIVCENGFYKFFPHYVGDIRRFSNKYGVELVQCEDYFTFKILAELPNYSFAGHPYGGLIATVNYAGKREEVMAKNGFTYYQSTQLLAPTTFVKKMDYSVSNYIVMDSLPQAFNYDVNGVITGFSLILDIDFMKYKIERWFYADI